MIRVLGIDPGLYGGLAVVESTQPFRPLSIVAAIPVPLVGEGSRQRVDEIYLYNWVYRLRPSVAAVERVGLFPGQDVAAGGIFMRAVGVLEAIPVLAGCKREMVEVVRWKRFHNLGSKSKTEKTAAVKERSRQKALSIFPHATELLNQKQSHGMAEAALIAVYQLQQIEAGN